MSAFSGQAATLSTSEKNDLRFLIEEEKMARDVYAELGAKWGRPFTNIVRAESRHMEMVQGLLASYKLQDPTSGTKPGEFKNLELKKLYADLVKQGATSRINALKVGALIEEKDIFDLSTMAKATEKPDLKRVYSNLAAASENHLRAFMSNLKNAGGTYTPKYMSQAEFDRVLNGR